MTRPTMCQRNPELFQTRRLVNGRYERAPAADLEAATHMCRACPQLQECRTRPPAADTVQAVRLYNAKLVPHTLDGYLNRYPSRTVAPICIENGLEGTVKGAALHTTNGEPLCQACTKAKEEAPPKRQSCSAKHPWPENPARDASGRKLCLICKEERDKEREALRENRAKRPPQPCGTIAAAMRHYRRNEPMCGPCANAKTAHRARMYRNAVTRERAAS